MKHKSAISITLDDNVLKFFSGKGRSGRINYVLTQYLRWNLGEKTDIGFNDQTDRNRMQSACTVVQEKFGNDSFEFKIMMMIKEMIE
jgi:hypothetical protein